ncbi:5-(carboxyamino)imidazole ribonucleotide mutase [Haliovirga abyssi]|uniref:N5-carboxyaminoimidazole ribonucleotide mutase n=1 Tax=Haliovirga abyssi TaxID=2996794 RepID=A0AAU9DJA6_9FUSO|nr:5-(carboxyamino)imidazole ribonucleotide mutase [Haliovirga abyssi]BDU50879.1 5-(carboxyamino)imidazole ribonucleotide mutase [Haliovirga abyssi]
MEKILVSIVMGSDSDLEVMSETAKLLEKFDISYEMKIYSAHRCTEEALNYVKEAEKNGVKIIIGAAGKAAHLPGVLAAHTNLPVIGVPMQTSDLGGVDSLYSIVQMPTGIPVATVAIGKTGAKNAAVLALKMLGIKYDKYRKIIKDYREEMRKEVLEKNRRLEEKGYKNY